MLEKLRKTAAIVRQGPIILRPAMRKQSGMRLYSTDSSGSAPKVTSSSSVEFFIKELRQSERDITTRIDRMENKLLQVLEKQSAAQTTALEKQSAAQTTALEKQSAALEKRLDDSQNLAWRLFYVGGGGLLAGLGYLHHDGSRREERLFLQGQQRESRILAKVEKLEKLDSNGMGSPKPGSVSKLTK